MGQKIHPSKFRLNTTQKHRSVWYAPFRDYPHLVEEDSKIREFVEKKFEFDGVSQVLLSRNFVSNRLFLEIETAKPWNVLSYDMSVLKDEVLLLATDIDEIWIDVVALDNPDQDANVLADYAVEQLSKRVAFKRVMREVIKRARAEDVAGVKVQISGRLNGAEMARTEWMKDGRMPLQTLRANINYASKKSKTIYGIMGVKIWVFTGEIMDESNIAINEWTPLL